MCLGELSAPKQHRTGSGAGRPSNVLACVEQRASCVMPYVYVHAAGQTMCVERADNVCRALCSAHDVCVRACA